MEELVKHTAQISFEQNAIVLIEDSYDVDMTFVFKLARDETRSVSYTKYNVLDRSRGEIIIYNVGNAKTVSLKQPMLVGSYGKQYRLYVSFIVFAPENVMSSYTIEISFFINKD